MLKIILSVVIGGLVGLGIFMYLSATRAMPDFWSEWEWQLHAVGGGFSLAFIIGGVIGGVLGSLINRLGAPKSDGPRY